jgi:Ribosome associated membrane protein RAMP4
MTVLGKFPLDARMSRRRAKVATWSLALRLQKLSGSRCSVSAAAHPSFNSAEHRQTFPRRTPPQVAQRRAFFFDDRYKLPGPLTSSAINTTPPEFLQLNPPILGLLTQQWYYPSAATPCATPLRLLWAYQIVNSTQAQTPQQRAANAKFAKSEQAKRGKPQGQVKRKEEFKSPISKGWIGTLRSHEPL